MQARSAISSHRSWVDFFQPTLDAAAVMASLAFVRWATGRTMEDMTIAIGLIAVVLFLLISHLTGLNRRSDIGSADREMTSIAVTWTLTVLVLGMLGFATRYSDQFSRSVMSVWFILTPSLIGLGRMSMRIVQRGLLRRGVGVRRVAIAGLNDLGRQTEANIDHDPALGLRVTGFYDDRLEARDDAETETPDDELAGSLNDLVAAARAGEVDTVLVTLPMRAEDRIRYLLDQLSDSTVSVYIVPDFFVFELLHSRWTDMGGLPAVSVFENPLYGVDGMVKRIADLLIAMLALIAGAIPMAMVALAVKLSSPGPVFFRQRRYGLDGQEISVWKFRSMRTCDNGPVVKQATKGDPRITRIGAILRKTSLDELPQLFNVMDGSMSLVGPRPHANAHNEQYRSLIRGYMLRHKVKPGITGLAQVNGCRGETETIDKMERRIEWDHNYIRHWSIWLDLKIMVKTLFVVWKQEEAY
jgi:putative colanic acid biosynthesis UDP-glucose lipid carrier transferase